MTASSPKTIRPCKKKIDYNPSGGFSFSPGGHPGGKVSLGFLLDRGKEKETLVFLNRVKTFEVDGARNFWTSKAQFKRRISHVPNLIAI